MATLAQISTALNNGKLLYLDRLSTLVDQLLNGCADCCDEELECLGGYLMSLQEDILWSHNTASTTKIYNSLITILGDFNAIYSPDASVVNNNFKYTVVSTKNIHADVEAYLKSRPGYAPYRVFGSNLRWNTPYGIDKVEWDQVISVPVSTAGFIEDGTLLENGVAL